MEALRPKDHVEAIAIFRSQVIAPLCVGTLSRGERADILRELGGRDFLPPGASATRRFAAPTIERWFYAFKKNGIEGLKPQGRSDRGHAQELSAELRELLLAIRREHSSASVPLILRTLEADGRLEKGKVSATTIRRLYVEHGLDRKTLKLSGSRATRLRWQASYPDEVWHADVCHGPSLKIDGRTVPLRIHAILDDHSRYIPAIQACATERESEMLALLVRALRRHRAPNTLYLDNGPTYTGEVLKTACARLGVALLHAKPHDPQARGKMERFWRTLREGCLDHLGTMSSLHDVQVRLIAFIDRHYHCAPHASLMGKSPAAVYELHREHEARDLSEVELAAALTVHARRRVRRDGTLDVAGVTFETTAGFLASRMVTIGRSLLDPSNAPWIEHDDRRFELQPLRAASCRSDREQRARSKKSSRCASLATRDRRSF
jgi:putative transposase